MFFLNLAVIHPLCLPYVLAIMDSELSIINNMLKIVNGAVFEEI